MNSKTSPGNTSSGYDPEMSELRNVVRVAAVMNRDAVKHIGVRKNTFIVSSARRNSLMLGKSS